MIPSRTSDFISALRNARHEHSPIPINIGALRADTNVVFQKSDALSSYHRYLNDVRALKMPTGLTRTRLERELLTHADTALRNAHDLAAAVIRITRQYH